MNSSKFKKYSIIKYLSIIILFYSLTLNQAFSAYRRPMEDYDEYKFEMETDLYDDYDEEIEEFYDPFEKFNRKIFSFNLGFNKIILEPIGKGYRKITTKKIRTGVDNILNNLRSPIILINSILQLDFDNTARTVSSFAINSTVGILGFFNPASKLGIYNEDKDFGQTLGKYKVGAGPYLVIPIFGPSTLRDGTGFVMDKAIDPLDYNMLNFGNERPLMSWEFRVARFVIYGINVSNFVVETFTPMIENSFDPYVMVRNAYLQTREYKINK